MKRLLSLIVSLSLVLVVCSTPVSASSSDSQTKAWQITMRGHIVRIETDFLAIHLKNPKNMATDPNKEDFISEIQHLPVTENTVIEDSAGKQLKFDSIVPGQEVTATFRYVTWSEPLSFDSEYYSNHYTIRECLKVSLIGETIKYKSKTTIGELEQDTMLGTVLSVDGSRVKVYIEGGRVFHKGSGTEFMASGVMEDEIRGNTKLLDEQGNLIQANNIKPFQRVLIKGKNHMYYDGSYGYSNSEFASIQVLGSGEKSLSASDIDGFRRMTATVLRRQKNADGEWQYVVRPDDNRRELKLQSEYVITQAAAVNAMSLEPGTHIEFSYTGLNYSTSPGKIIECYKLEVLKDEVVKMTGNPTPDDFKGEDFFIYQKVVCINTANIDWINKLVLTEGELLGEIKRTGIAENYTDWDATILSVGTKIYQHAKRYDVLIAVKGENKIPYMKMIEG